MKKKRRRLIHINPEDGLEAAILLVARYDYQDALLDQMEDRECPKIRREVRKLEKFFRSDWGQSLSYGNGELIIEKCKQKVLEGGMA